MVALAVLAGLAITTVMAGPVGADPSVKRLWAVARDRDGHLKVLKGMPAAVAETSNELGHDDTQVLSLEQDSPVHQLGTNDPMRADQWALDAVPYEAAWGVTQGAGITVAVVDTGVLGNHEDLAGSVVPGIDLADDWSTYDPGRTGMVDPGGHGTHVAGIIAAHANNGLGIAGAAPAVHILPVRVLDAGGGGNTSDVATGIIWAADHGARVINLSLGGGPSDGMRQAMQYALTKNALSVAAAGNSGDAGNAPTYPAAYPEALSVAAVNSGLGHPSWSNTGSYVDIAAPGDLIWSSYGSGRSQYALMSGTSMATPYVSAAAALVMSENHAMKATDVAGALEFTATDLGAHGRDPVFGYGLVNPQRALVAASPDRINRGTEGHGYWVVTADGHVWGYGAARSYGDMHGRPLSAPIVAAARTPDGRGYWLAGADGAVYSFGDAAFHGSMAGRHLNSPIVGMAAMPQGNGYVLLGRDGGIFTFGGAHFYGSTGGMRLNAPVLDMTMTANGGGYWFVGADGGIFSFGNAKFRGSTGSIRLARPVRSMTASTAGQGYWMVADDGGIFAFNVPFRGSMPSVRSLYGWPYVPSVRMRALGSTDGYYILGVNGNVWAFGAAKNFGSAPSSWAVDLMLAP